MMIPKDAFARDGNMPVVQIVEECLGIADTAKREKRTVTNLAEILHTWVSAMATKSQQARLREKNGIFMGVAGFHVGALRLARDNQDVGAPASGSGLAQNSG